MFPTGVVPMTAQVGRPLGHDHGVARARLDGLVAAGADVAAAGLVGLDPADLEVVGGVYSWTSSIRVPNAVFGCRNATVVPRLPVRGCSSTTRAPCALTSSSTSSVLSTRYPTWWMPSPFFSMYLASGESSRNGVMSWMYESATLVN